MGETHILRCLAAFCGTMLGLNAAVLEPIRVDGQFDDWSRNMIVAVDPAGDASGAFDITRLFLHSDGSVAVLRFDTGRVLNLQSGPLEDGTLVFRFMRKSDRAAVEVNVRQRSVLSIAPSGELTQVGWHAADYRSAPTFASHEFEFRLDLSVIGASAGDRIELTISGSDELDEPVLFTLSQANQAEERPARSMDRPRGTRIRTASLNTWRNGIVDPKRAAPLRRLLAAVSPDVIMLQEEPDTSVEDVRSALASALPGDWNVVKAAGTVIATRMPLVQFPSLEGRPTAAIATHDAIGVVLLICVHMRCCGHITSAEDSVRIRQTRAIIQTIDLARARYGADLPIVLAGDWNLVGSRSPLDMLTNPAGANLRHVEARHLTTDDTYTWFNPKSDFAPGMLDLATVDALSSASRAFLVDSRKLSKAQLNSTGLRPEDSDASDHLLLVVDMVR